VLAFLLGRNNVAILSPRRLIERRARSMQPVVEADAFILAPGFNFNIATLKAAKVAS
jgi:hypothetical protein